MRFRGLDSFSCFFELHLFNNQGSGFLVTELETFCLAGAGLQETSPKNLEAPNP